jgi:hypothetical protein
MRRFFSFSSRKKYARTRGGPETPSVLEEEIRVELARRVRVDDVAARAVLLGAELLRDRLGGGPVPERRAEEHEA